MSLILEALRKLEREKQAPDRGFLVMAHTPWGAGRPWSLFWLGGLVLVVAIGASVMTALVLRGGPTAPLPVAQAESPQPGRDASPSSASGQRPALATPVVVASPVTPAPQATAGAVVPMVLPSALGPVSAPPPAVDAAPSPGPPVTSPADFRLMAISEQDGHPVAIVNDRLVREGDAFDGICILRIGATEVEIEVHGRKRILTFQ